MSGADHQAAHRVLTATFGWAQPFELKRMPPGFSGGVVFRCRRRNAPGGHEVCALKRLPSGTVAARVAEVHRVIESASRTGCDFVPRVCRTNRGESVAVDAGGRIWELLSWMPGGPVSELPADDLTDELLSELGATLATLHSAFKTQAVGPHGAGMPPAGRPAGIPAVVARQRRLTELAAMPELSSGGRDVVSPSIAGAVDSGGPVPSTLAAAIAAARQWLAQRWSADWPEMMAALARFDRSPAELQWVLRDVHSQHILVDTRRQTVSPAGLAFPGDSAGDSIFGGSAAGFSAICRGGRVTGVIDYDAVQIDTPATDLARLVGSLGPPSVVRTKYWVPVLAGYQSVSPFSQADETLAKTLCFTTQWISLANWVVWVGIERKRFDAGENAVKIRVWDLLLRLQFMSN